MAIDWGGKRVGLALSDSTQTIARPLTILHREGGDSLSDPDAETLKELVHCKENNAVSGIVFGIPYYHLSGDANPKARLFLEAGQVIGYALGLPVIFSDEGHTSSDAWDIVLRKEKKRKNFTARRNFSDHLAAAALLQRYLDEISSRRKSTAVQS
jgi:putative Holliday junction resolvase